MSSSHVQPSAVQGASYGHATSPADDNREGFDSDTVEASVLFELRGVNVFRVDNVRQGQQAFHDEDSGSPITEEVASDAELFAVQLNEESDKRYLLVIGELQIGLSPRTPAFKISEFAYVFADPQCVQQHLVVVLPRTVERSVLVAFDTFLQKRSALHERADVSSGSASESKMPDQPLIESDGGARASAPATTTVVMARVLPPHRMVGDRGDRVATTGHKIAKGISSGSVMLSRGIVAGGAMLSEQIRRAGDVLHSNITPDAQPKRVSAKVHNRLSYASKASTMTVKLAKALAKTSVAVAERVAQELSVAVSSTDAYARFKTQTEQPRAEAAKHIAASTLEAMVAVYMAMEEAGVMVLSQSCDTSADLLGRKYGEEVRNASHLGFGAVKNFGSAAIAMRRVGPMAIAKRAAVTSTVDVLSTDDEKAARRAIAAELNELRPEEQLLLAAAKATVKEQVRRGLPPPSS